MPRKRTDWIRSLSRLEYQSKKLINPCLYIWRYDNLSEICDNFENLSSRYRLRYWKIFALLFLYKESTKESRGDRCISHDEVFRCKTRSYVRGILFHYYTGVWTFEYEYIETTRETIFFSSPKTAKSELYTGVINLSGSDIVSTKYISPQCVWKHKRNFLNFSRRFQHRERDSELLSRKSNRTLSLPLSLMTLLKFANQTKSRDSIEYLQLENYLIFLITDLVSYLYRVTLSAPDKSRNAAWRRKLFSCANKCNEAKFVNTMIKSTAVNPHYVDWVVTFLYHNKWPPS